MTRTFIFGKDTVHDKAPTFERYQSETIRTYVKKRPWKMVDSQYFFKSPHRLKNTFWLHVLSTVMLLTDSVKPQNVVVYRLQCMPSHKSL